MLYDTIIIGSGPAGLTASIYASRYKMLNLVIGKVPGGTITMAHKVENFPGFVSISGVELGQKMIEQVKALGVEILMENVGRIELVGENAEVDKPFLKVTTESNKDFEAKSLIVTTGTERRKLNVPGEKEYLGRGVSYCTTCLLPGEEVVANSSLKKIDEIGISQKVLTSDGTFQNINQILSRNYEGEIVRIKTRFFTEPVRLTANHPILCTKREKDGHRNFSVVGKSVWRNAGDLTESEILLYPIISEVEDRQKIKFSEILGVKAEDEMVRNFQETYTSKRISNEIPINKDFLRLAGYYLAEGCATQGGLMFCFNLKEKEYIDDVRKLLDSLFGLKVNLKIQGRVMRINIYSKLVRDLFYLLFGKSAPEKKVPQWMITLPPAKQRELIKGFYRGDGCLRDKDFCLVTVSRTLTYQLRDILLRFGIIPSIIKREKEKLNRIPNEIGKRKIRFNCDKYHIVIGGPSLGEMSKVLGVHHPRLERRAWICHHALIKGNYLYLPIREVTREIFKGRVYNLAVEKNNTYIAKNFIVHNCDAPFFKEKTVALIGGSNTACSGAIHMAEYANKIYLIYRKNELRGDPVWVEEIKHNPKIEVIYNTNVTEIMGDGKRVTGLKLDVPYNRFAETPHFSAGDEGKARFQASPEVNSKAVESLQKKTLGFQPREAYNGAGEIKVDGVFVEIGGVPLSSLLIPLGVELDENNFVRVSDKMETNIPGIFAAGDFTTHSLILSQTITACADGAIAAASAYKYLKGQKAPEIIRV